MRKLSDTKIDSGFHLIPALEGGDFHDFVIRSRSGTIYASHCLILFILSSHWLILLILFSHWSIILILSSHWSGKEFPVHKTILSAEKINTDEKYLETVFFGFSDEVTGTLLHYIYSQVRSYTGLRLVNTGHVI